MVHNISSVFMAFVDIRISKFVLKDSILLEHLVVECKENVSSTRCLFLSAEIPTASLKEKGIGRKNSLIQNRQYSFTRKGIALKQVNQRHGLRISLWQERIPPS